MSSSKKDDNLVREGQVTYEMYAAMPDDGQRYEIIDGSLEAMSPGPSYARFGVPEYWVVDPEARTLELYRLHEGSNLYMSCASCSTRKISWFRTSCRV